MPTNSFERGIIPKGEKILNQENSQLLQQLRSMFVDWFNYTQSSGYFSGGAISDDGDGTITVAAGSGIIKVTDSPIGVTEFFTWSANTSLVMVDNDVNYIYVDYSAGTPISKTTTDRTTIEQNRMFTLGRVYRSGTTIHIIQSGVLLYNFLRREHERTLTLHGFERVSGGVVTETGTRNLATTVGSFYLGLSAIATTAQNTSGADKFTYWYRDGGTGWTEVIDQTQINNTQYDDGDGTLGTLTANRYGVHWVFIHFDSDIHVVYGQGDYTLANAEKATLPTDLPDAVSKFGILAAKIIIQKSAAAFKSIVSAYTVSLHSVFTNADAVAAVATAGTPYGVGVGNAFWVNPTFIGVSDTGANTLQVSHPIYNVGATNYWGLWQLAGIPFLLGSYKLYLNNIKFGLKDADANDEINDIYMYGWTDHDSVETIYNLLDDQSIPGERPLSAVGMPKDLSLYRAIYIKSLFAVDGAGQFEISYIRLQVYYDT